MSARDELVDGATVPWNFLTPKKPAPDLPPQVTRTPAQETRHRLIAAGRWRRP